MKQEYEKEKSYSKIERQLLLYEILYSSREIVMDELMRRLKAGKKTIQRDVEDLTDVRLIKLNYSRKNKAYKTERVDVGISEPEGTQRYLHLKKLKRLGNFMVEISDASEYASDEALLNAIDLAASEYANLIGNSYLIIWKTMYTGSSNGVYAQKFFSSFLLE